jgi:hypothetical protein
MNQDGDGHIPIPREMLDRLKGDSAEEKIDHLRRMVQQAQLDGTAKADDPRLPIWHASEIIALRGVYYRVVEITADRLVLEPKGFVRE